MERGPAGINRPFVFEPLGRGASRPAPVSHRLTARQAAQPREKEAHQACGGSYELVLRGIGGTPVGIFISV